MLNKYQIDTTDI